MSWILLIVGLTILTMGATWLTNGSSAIAKRMNISEYVIGMTIVAVGTSLPELTVSTTSALAGNADIAIGNVVGSNIFNIFAVLGVCSVISAVPISRGNVRYDIPISIGVALLLAFMLLDGGLSRIEGVILFALFIVVMIISYRLGKKEATSETKTEDEAPMAWWKSILMIVVGTAGLIYGAGLMLDSSIAIARSLGVSEAVIAITIVAGGTSLPELAASLVAAFKGHSALALGNVVGSCVANILLILGLCSAITPLSLGGVTMTDVWVMVASSVALFLAAIAIGNRVITRIEGVAFLAIYVIYIVYLVKTGSIAGA